MSQAFPTLSQEHPLEVSWSKARALMNYWKGSRKGYAFKYASVALFEDLCFYVIHLY